MKTATLERKTLDVRIKSIDADTGEYVLYAASWTLDRTNEMIERGAFSNLAEFVQDGFLALGHDAKALPIGTISEATQDSVGLLVKGVFHSTPEAQAARTVMKERMGRGKAVKASIGFVTTKDAMVTERGKSYRLLKEITLYEISYVNIPANPAAVAVSVKGLRPERANPADVGKARRDFAEYEYRQTLGLADRVAIQRAEIDYLCAIEDMPRRLLPASRA
jgi:HK97 family phage prohead protease